MNILDCCDICGEDHNTTLCPELGLPDTITQPQPATRARLTLPPNLEVVDNGSGLIGVVARETIEKRIQFGPFEAKRTTHVFEDTGFFTLKLLSKGGTSVVLDTTDENECNWMCLVRCALSEGSQNCMAYQLGTNIFYSTTRQIAAREELQVWYAPHFAKKLEKPSKPDPSYKVLLGLRIEPLEEKCLTQKRGQSVIPQQPRGELVQISVCPRCPREFKTQTDMVQHLRDHVIPNPYQNKKSKGRGRPRTQPDDEDSASPSCKRKRGRPKKDEILNKNRTGEEQDSADESDDEQEKKLIVDWTDPPPVTAKLDSVDNDVWDRDYLPVSGVYTAKRRFQPKRTSRGQHSKYGNDFVVGKIGSFEVKKEDTGDENLTGDKKQTQTEIVTGSRPEIRGKERPRKSKISAVNLKVDSSDDSDKGLSLRIPLKTYERKTSAKADDENIGTGAVENVISFSEEVPDGDTIVEKFVDGVNIEVVVKSKRQLEVSNKMCDLENQKEDVSEINTSQDLPMANESDTKSTHSADVLIVEVTDQDILLCEENIKETDDLSNAILNEGILDEGERVQTTGETVDENDSTEIKVGHSEMANDLKNGGGDKISNEDEQQTDNIVTEAKEIFLETKETNASGENHETVVNEGDEISNDGVNIKVSNATAETVKDKIIYLVEKDGMMYKCKICGKVFTQLSYLKLHIPKHSDKFKCHKCQKHFTRKESLQKHKCAAVKTLLEQPIDDIAKKVENEGKECYQCMNCEESFSTYIEVIAHFVTHSGEAMSCLKCNKTLQSGETLEDHKCSAEETENNFACDLCSQSFTSAKYLHRHLVMHTDLFKCKKCDFCFSRKDSLQKHVMKCCPELADSYKIQYCSLCYRVFSTKAGKINHVSKCKWVKCEKCSRVFSSKEDMDSHECFEEAKSVEGTNIEFSCGKCGKAFMNNYYLQQHQKIHKELFQCGVCSKYVKSEEELFTHARICQMVQTIRAEGAVNCDLCEEIFKKPKDLRLHYQMHTHPYSCSNCEKRFIKESGLLTHEQNCKLSEGSFTCEECPKSFSSSRFLTRHIAFTHRKELFKCVNCNKGFSRRVKYRNHICKLEDGTHGYTSLGKTEEVKKLCCATCGKTFSSKSNLNKHVISHGEKKFRCQHCGKRFHYETYLSEHISCVHLNLYKYQCTECGKLLKSKTGLIAHVKQFHQPNSEVYTCEVCGKTFKQKGNMNTHMYSHVESRNFSCQYCHKTFKYPDQLSRHRLIHTMKNKLQCTFCDKKFVKEYELRRHEMVFHSGLVYVCNICFARCGHKHTMVRHYKRKHPDQVHVLSVPQVLDRMLKRIDELPDSGATEIIEGEIPNTMINETNMNVINAGSMMPPQEGSVMPPQEGPVMLTHDAAEVLHSLSNAVAITEPQSGGKKAKLGPIILRGRGSDRNQGIQIRLQPPESSQQNSIHSSQDQTIKEDPSQVEYEIQLAETGESIATHNIPENNKKVIENIENTISLDNAMININGQYIPISNLQSVPQEQEVIDAGDGQIVILQIWNSDDKESQQFVQVPAEQGENIIQLADENNAALPI